MPDPTQTPSVVPPPVTEATVRTMAGDIEAVAAAGGSTASLASSGAAIAHPVQAGERSHLMSALLGWLAVLIALLALVTGIWFGYRYFAARAETANVPVITAVPAAPETAPSLASLAATVPSHATLLNRAAPLTVSFPIVASSSDLKTRYQLMSDGLNRIPATVRVVELLTTDADNKPLSFPGYAAASGAETLFEPGAFEDNFAPDFTLLAVRGQAGFSAAYVLALKPNSARLYAQPAVRAMEGSSALPSLFLQLPGTQSLPFADGTVQDQPVRTATFVNPAGTIVYGFFKDRLVIATSQQALNEVLSLLCVAPGSC